MNVDFSRLREERRDWPRSVLPLRPPKRRWVRTRACTCGECRFTPMTTRPCPKVIEPTARASEWLWQTEARGA